MCRNTERQPGKGIHTKQQTAPHDQPLRAKATIPEPDQVLNIHLNGWYLNNCLKRKGNSIANCQF